MVRPRLRPLSAVLLVGAMLLVGCGVEAGDAQGPDTSSSKGDDGVIGQVEGNDEADEGTTTTSELSGLDAQMRDLMVDTYVDLGFEQDDAECMADAIVGSMEGGEVPDITAGMDAINECDIDPAELREFNESFGSAEEGMKAGMVSSLKSLGMSEQDAECVADAYVDEYGLDQGPSTDGDAMAALFEQCGTEPPATGGD